MNQQVSLEARVGIEPTNKGLADLVPVCANARTDCAVDLPASANRPVFVRSGHKISIAEAERTVKRFCAERQIAPSALTGSSRVRDLVAERHALIWLLRERGCTLTRIGQLLNLHHTSVLYALRKYRPGGRAASQPAADPCTVDVWGELAAVREQAQALADRVHLLALEMRRADG